MWFQRTGGGWWWWWWLLWLRWVEVEVVEVVVVVVEEKVQVVVVVVGSGVEWRCATARCSQWRDDSDRLDGRQRRSDDSD